MTKGDGVGQEISEAYDPTGRVAFRPTRNRKKKKVTCDVSKILLNFRSDGGCAVESE